MIAIQMNVNQNLIQKMSELPDYDLEILNVMKNGQIVKNARLYGSKLKQVHTIHYLLYQKHLLPMNNLLNYLN